MTRVTGSCHCGAVRFEAEGEGWSGMECNCSHCGKKGFVPAFLGRQDCKLTKGESTHTTYHFNRGAIDHNFCATSGTQAFTIGAGPGGKEMAAVNLRCVDGLDRSQITLVPINGKDF